MNTNTNNMTLADRLREATAQFAGSETVLLDALSVSLARRPAAVNLSEAETDGFVLRHVTEREMPWLSLLKGDALMEAVSARGVSVFGRSWRSVSGVRVPVTLHVATTDEGTASYWLEGQADAVACLTHEHKIGAVVNGREKAVA